MRSASPLAPGCIDGVSRGLQILDGCATIELEGNKLIVGAVEDLEPVQAGQVELLELVAGAIEDSQGVDPTNIKNGELVVVGVEALEFGQAVEGEFRELVEATVKVFEAGQRADLQVRQGVAVAVKADYLAVRGCVFVGRTRPKGDGPAGGNRNLHGVAHEGRALGDLEGDKTGGGVGFKQVALGSTV